MLIWLDIDERVTKGKTMMNDDCWRGNGVKWSVNGNNRDGIGKWVECGNRCAMGGFAGKVPGFNVNIPPRASITSNSCLFGLSQMT